MSLSMYQASVPMFVHQLESLSTVLTKSEAYASEQGIDPQELLDGRLAPDMFALPRQIQIATDTVKGAVARLGAIEVPVYADEEKTFAELQARIAKTIALLKSVPADKIDGSEERDIQLKAGDRTLEFKGQFYLLHFVIPNFFFHVATAYGILRHKGAPIGKLDYLGPIA